MINSVCGIRSTGRICTDIADSLTRLGHEVKIAYGRKSVPEKYKKYALRVGNGVSTALDAVQSRLFDGAGFGSRLATRRLIKKIREFDPDVIHLHNIHSYYVNVKILFDYLRTCGKKVIWTLHDGWAFTGHSAYCDAARCERWTDGCGGCPLTGEYPRSFIDLSGKNWLKKKNALTGVENLTIVTPSYWLAGLVKRSFLSEYPVRVIHNGVDTESFCHIENDFRKRYNIGSRFMLLGVASVWNDLKGYSDFIKLSGMLGGDYAVVLVGLTKRQKRRLPDGVIGIERTADVRELAGIYSSADLFLNLTYCDNYPSVNIEAIACGTQVLTYDTGGSAESARESGGCVVPQGDLRAVCECVRRYRENGTAGVERPARDAVSGKRTVTAYIKEYGID